MMGGLTLVFTVNGLSAETKENDHGARITFLMNPFVFKNLSYRYGSWIFRLGRYYCFGWLNRLGLPTDVEA